MPFSILPSNSATGYFLNKSLRFRSSASAYLNRTPAVAGNQYTWTFSFWVKRGIISSFQYLYGVGGGSNDSTIAFYSDDSLTMYLNDGAGATGLRTTQVFRDPSAWYHIVIALDTTQATASNRMKMYVNGSEVTAFQVASYPAQNSQWQVNTNAYAANIGRGRGGSYSDCYMAEYNFIDGQALTPSSFGSTNSLTGVWQPAKYTGTYGTNGFYLPFTNTTSTTTIGYDFSGNGNNWTSNNISLTAGSTYDSMTDVPTLTSATTANYAVLNPLRPFGGSLSDVNLTAVTGNAGSANAGYVTSTIWLPTSRKFYFEATPTTVGEIAIGLTTDSNSRAAMYYRSGEIYINGSITTTQSSYTNNDVIGVAVDIGSATVQFYKNNTAQGSAQSISAITSPLVACLAHFSGSGSSTANVNFGQQPFSYTPPTGFVALNTFNLPEPSIKAGNKNFNAVTWTGNGTSSGRSITGVGFQPDLVWGKARSVAYGHGLYDAVRGTGKLLVSNNTNAEATNFTYGYLSAFDSDGFTTSAGATSNENWNQTSDTYVAWNWKANGAGSSNTAGSITSTVSANPTAGFSVVTYASTTGTVGHGLGVAPAMIIMKGRNVSDQWTVWHQAFSANYGLPLNDTAGLQTNGGFWNNTLPTSSVFSQGSWDSGYNKVAYCWSEIAGFSKFTSYVGNASTDGPFVYCGFRPKFIMTKAISTGSIWGMWDTSRNTYNAAGNVLQAQSSDAEISPYNIDILSNGFKMRDTNSNWNGSGQTFIVMAFAENPFKNALAR